MAVEFKDNTGTDIEPGDTVEIVKSVVVESVEATREGSQLTYSDGQNGRAYIDCDQVKKTASRV